MNGNSVFRRFFWNVTCLVFLLQGGGFPQVLKAQDADAIEGKGAVDREVVILLHGLARSSRSMGRMEQALTTAGYSVRSINYASTRKTVEQLAVEDLAPVVKECRATNPAKIHFVAHSLGNIVLRQYVVTNPLPAAGRIVMLGPPSQGSEVVDKLGHLWLFKWINGPAGQQLGTASNALPSRLPVPPGEVGVIAGTLSINWFLSALIPGRDDGKVSIERTKLAGMTDFATVSTAHPFLMRNDRVIQMTLSFLQYGRFDTNSPARPFGVSDYRRN